MRMSDATSKLLVGPDFPQPKRGVSPSPREYLETADDSWIIVELSISGWQLADGPFL